ncbi:MAG: fibrobacter succinogenes major paralogous domain-containing protein [Ferruginibacter sp.]
MKTVSILLFVLMITGYPLFNQNIRAQTVRIGNTTWMSVNLSVDTFRNGDKIPEASTPEAWKKAGESAKPAWCWAITGDSLAQQRAGRLYNWFAVSDPRKLAPHGWRIPTDSLYIDMMNQIGGQQQAGKQLKAVGAWTEKITYKGTDFSAVPTGFINADGERVGYGRYAYWWTSNESNALVAWYRGLRYLDDELITGGNRKETGYSVRCVRE